eukprot:1945557-Amphidinium_carterae.1
MIYVPQIPIVLRGLGGLARIAVGYCYEVVALFRFRCSTIGELQEVHALRERAQGDSALALAAAQVHLHRL